MSSKLKVLQVIPKLGYGGAETGCYDLAHYLYEQSVKSYLVTSGGPLLKYIDNPPNKEINIPPIKGTIGIFFSNIQTTIIASIVAPISGGIAIVKSLLLS